MRWSVLSLTAILLALGLAGCKSRPQARYVMRSPNTGVIAMPADTAENRERAIALMHSHFPEGYEIIAEGEEAVLAPLPQQQRHVFADPLSVSQGRMCDPVQAAAWREPGFQREIENLPGTPQAMQGYAQPPMPGVGIRVGDPPPPRPSSVISSEWRILYRRKGAVDSNRSDPQSLFPELRQQPQVDHSP